MDGNCSWVHVDDGRLVRLSVADGMEERWVNVNSCRVNNYIRDRRCDGWDANFDGCCLHSVVNVNDGGSNLA